MPPGGTLPNSCPGVPCGPGPAVGSPVPCRVPPHGFGASCPDMLLICSPRFHPGHRRPTGRPGHIRVRTPVTLAITRSHVRNTLGTQGRGDDSFMTSKIIAVVSAVAGARPAARSARWRGEAASDVGTATSWTADLWVGVRDPAPDRAG